MSRTIDTGTDDLTATVGDEGVAVITMNRPERRNALSTAMGVGLAQALREVETDQAARCIVLTGAEGAFCAGGDVKGLRRVMVTAVANVGPSVTGDLRTILDLESTHHRHTATTNDHLEASKALVEKRVPTFEGR